VVVTPPTRSAESHLVWAEQHSGTTVTMAVLNMKSAYWTSNVGSWTRHARHILSFGILRKRQPAEAPAPVGRSETANPGPSAGSKPTPFALIAFLAFVALYGVLGMSLSNAPLQDLPNHLARAHVISDLLFNHGHQFGATFSVALSFNPYLIGDLILAVLDRYVGATAAASLWICVAVLLLPFSVVFALKKQGVSNTAALTGGILSFYVATSWFFIMGFMNYQLALASAIFSYGWFLKAKASGNLQSYCGYLLVVFFSYALHLSSLIFISALVGILLLIDLIRRRVSFIRAAVLMACPVLLLALHFGFVAYSAPGNWPTSWGTLLTKLQRIGSPVGRFSPALDLLLLALFLVFALFPLFPRLQRSLWAELAPLVACAAVFLGIFFALPSYTGNIYSVDVRALPYALLFLVFAGVAAADKFAAATRVQLVLATVFATLNLVYVAYNVLPQNHDLGRYRAIAAAVPAGAHVLPINTRPDISRYRPFVHAGSFATVDSGAITPYLFAADKDSAMAYFGYHSRDSGPDEYWDINHSPAGKAAGYGDYARVWHGIQQTYQYLLITVPWDRDRIPIPYTVVTSNEVAALLKVTKQ
jgi:hypothetical protein